MPFQVGPAGDLVGSGGGHVGPEAGLTGATASELHQLFDIGSRVGSALHQPFAIVQYPPPSSVLHQILDLVGAVGSALHQPFALLPATSAINEVQRIVSAGVIASYTLTFSGQTTTSIAGTANAAAAQAALEALSNLAPGDVAVTGGPLNSADLVIAFGGAYAGVNVPQITVTPTAFSAWSDATAYTPGDMVSLDGASWVCVLANTALRPFPPDYREAMLVTNPVSYWRLGEASPSTMPAADVMGANAGTYGNGPTSVAGLLAGDSDTAVAFVAASYTYASFAGIDLTAGDFTILAWVKRTGASASEIPIGAAFGGFEIRLASGVPALRCSGVAEAAGASAGAATGVATMIAVSYVKSTGAVAYNVAGAPAGTTAFSPAYTPGALTNLLGNSPVEWAGLDGTLDESAIWTRALTPAENAGLYAVGTGTVYWTAIGAPGTPSGTTDTEGASSGGMPMAGTSVHQLFDIFTIARVNEVQVIVSGGAITSYVLTFAGQSTTPIAGTANAAAVQAALEALSNIDPGDVAVTGGPLSSADLTVTFGGVYSGIDVLPQIAVITSYVLTFDGQSTASIAGTDNAAAVQSALEALSNLAPGDVTVTGGPLDSADIGITFGGAFTGIDVPQIEVAMSYVLTYGGQTTGTIAGTANAAAVQAALEALSNIDPGDVAVTGGPLDTAELVITFVDAIDDPQMAVGVQVTVTEPIGFTVTNGGPTIIGGGAVPTIPPIWRPLMVFDKAGGYLGSIAAFNVTNPPVRYLRSRRVTNEGGMTFNIPRSSPDIGLIASDRLIRLQSVNGENPWWGTMSPQVSAGGIEEVTCRDPFTVLRDGAAITLVEEVGDGTPATGVYTRIMALHNDLRAATGEAQWELDLQGSRPFHGDLDLDTDTLSALDLIIARSRTEIAWDSRLDGNRLVPILRVRDAFAAGSGAAIFDGPDGNVVAGVQVIEDPTPLVFSIRLTGMTTDLSKCLPAWAQWALLDVTPEVTVSVDPGERRNRQRLDESLDWGLSKAAVEAQCNAIQDWIWGMYRSFLMAIHDIEGRPWHDGWAYLGPPSIYEPMNAGKDSLSRRAWKTRLQLVEVMPNEPASAVMISEKSSQTNLREWLIVTYDRVAGVQGVGVWAIPTVVGLSLVHWTTASTVTVYKVSGGRIVSRAPEGPTGAFVDPYSVRVWDPVAKRYRNLRRIINGDWALAYYIDAADTHNTLADLGPDAAIDTVSGDGSSLIAKMYDFESDLIDNYDPRRDGIGILKAAPTVFFGAETSRARWHVTSFDVGGGASTSLTTGISATATDFEVDSIMGFPDPVTGVPFLATIGSGSTLEVVLVLSMLGAEWHVVRGQNGTEAIIHEAGSPVGRTGADAWAGFPFPYTWPEGAQWAADDLAELSKPRIDLGVHVSHFRGDQLTLDYGSTHSVDVATEGPPARWVGTGRAIGWSTGDGETECVLEWVT
jgi:hypothetical protein